MDVNNFPTTTEKVTMQDGIVHKFVVWTSTSSIRDITDDYVVTLKPIFALPTGLAKLLNFRDLLESRRESSEPDPVTFVTDDLGSRFGKGSKDLLLGVGVDTRSNPVHRHAIQYISDFGLIPSISSSLECPEMVMSVSYGCRQQHKVHSSIFWYSKCTRMLVISLEDQTAFSIDFNQYPLMSIGDVAIIPFQALEQFKLISGSALYVILGHPATYFRGFGRAPTDDVGYTSISSTVTLNSVAYPGIQTVNRQTKGKRLPLIACPDCRRPLEISKSSPTTEEVLNPEVLVTVVCDEEECRQAIECRQKTSTHFVRRIVFVTNKDLLTPELTLAWPEHFVVSPILKHSQKRGLADYLVPNGFVSPVLFPNTSDLPLKTTMYTIIQIIKCEALAEIPILLMEPKGDLSVCIKPSKKVYDLMMHELRDWNHPCHKTRRSAISFVKEWVETYS